MSHALPSLPKTFTVIRMQWHLFSASDGDKVTNNVRTTYLPTDNLS